MGECVQGELFTVSCDPPPRLATRPAAPRFVKYRPTGRVLCDDCIRAIHALGVERAPYPVVARWRFGDLRLCEPHKRERTDARGPRQG